MQFGKNTDFLGKYSYARGKHLYSVLQKWFLFKILDVREPLVSIVLKAIRWLLYDKFDTIERNESLLNSIKILYRCWDDVQVTIGNFTAKIRNIWVEIQTPKRRVGKNLYWHSTAHNKCTIVSLVTCNQNNFRFIKFCAVRYFSTCTIGSSKPQYTI